MTRRSRLAQAAAGPPSNAQRVRAELRKFPTLDPQAVLAVASREGLGGGIGDQGTSFGPFQLHQGGALPSGIQDPQAWAWSPAGIDYALSRIQGVAGGLHGGPAVANIVSRFERPADPQAEITGALRAYGLPSPASSGFQEAYAPMPGLTASPLALAAADPSAGRRAFTESLLEAMSPKGVLSPSGLSAAIQLLHGSNYPGAAPLGTPISLGNQQGQATGAGIRGSFDEPTQWGQPQPRPKRRPKGGPKS